MKKVMYLLLIVVLMSFASCSKKDGYNPKELGSNDYPFAIETLQKIVTAFDEEEPSRIGLSQIFFIDPEDNVGFELAIGAKLKD